MNFWLHKHWWFYQYTISRKIVIQSWRDISTYETDCPPPDTNPVFYSLREVLLLMLLSSLLLLFVFGSKWFTLLGWLKKMSTFSVQKAPMTCAKYSLCQPSPSSGLHLAKLSGTNRTGQKCASFFRPKEIALGRLGSLILFGSQSRRRCSERKSNKQL